MEKAAAEREIERVAAHSAGLVFCESTFPLEGAWLPLLLVLVLVAWSNVGGSRIHHVKLRKKQRLKVVSREDGHAGLARRSTGNSTQVVCIIKPAFAPCNWRSLFRFFCV